MTPLPFSLLGVDLEHAPLPMASLEGQMHVVRYVNPAFCQLIDKTRDELLEKEFRQVLPDKDDFLALLDRVYVGGKAESHTMQEDSDPRRLFASYVGWPIMGEEAPTGVMVQIFETAPLLEKTRAMNEALMLGMLRQHKSTEASDLSNIQLQTEIVDRKRREEEMVALSMTDPLTGVANRRLMVQALTLEVGRAERTGSKFCACMIDIDHFKHVNDVYGHETGDNVLVAFGEILRRYTRPTDVVARFGGEEFVVLLSNTTLEHGIATANRIREAFAGCRIAPMTDPVTASFGVAELASGERGEVLLHRADKALYEAKESGRNRVMTS